MAITDRGFLPPWPGAVWSDCLGWTGPVTLPGFAETWYGGEYPTARGESRPILGWQCSGCGRGYAPRVGECSHCGPVMETATSTNSCQPAREGGMCGCEEADHER